jgi:hypothetical protein
LTYDSDAPEQLNRDELNMLKARLEMIGAGWSYGRGLHGLHTASRRATDPQQQASLTAAGLLEAVEQREQQLASGARDHVVPVHTGLSSTHD